MLTNVTIIRVASLLKRNDENIGDEDRSFDIGTQPTGVHLFLYALFKVLSEATLTHHILEEECIQVYVRRFLSLTGGSPENVGVGYSILGRIASPAPNDDGLDSVRESGDRGSSA